MNEEIKSEVHTIEIPNKIVKVLFTNKVLEINVNGYLEQSKEF